MARALANTLSAQYIPEPSRDLMALGPETNLLDEPFRAYLTVRQIVVETALEPGKTAVIDAGTPVVDAFNTICGYAPPPGLERLRGDYAYSVAFLTDLADCPVVDDGFRITDPDLRNQIHSLIRETLGRSGVPTYVVAGDPTQRVETALRVTRAMLVK